MTHGQCISSRILNIVYTGCLVEYSTAPFSLDYVYICYYTKVLYDANVDDFTIAGKRQVILVIMNNEC